jgi:hypothetical protein
MRKLLLSLLLLFCFNSLRGQEIINVFLGRDLLPDKYIEVNKITRQDVYEYRLNRKGIADSAFVGATNFYYNNKHQLAEEVFFNQQNFLFKKNIYSFNVFGSVSKKISYSYAKVHYFKDPITTSEFGYDSLGRMTDNIWYDLDTLNVYSQKREYDEHGDLHRILQKTNNQPYYVKNIASYDDDHNLTNIDYLYSQNKLDYSYVFKTDSTTNGDKILYITKNDKDVCVYRFNKYQQFIEWSTYQTVGLSKTTYTQKLIYNSDGTPYCYLFYINNKMEKMYKFYYHN